MADPDLQIRRGGHPDTEIGGVGLKKIFRPFRPQFGLKIREARAPRGPPLDPPLLNLSIGLVTVLEAILTSRQPREKLQCLYQNLMSNTFRNTVVQKRIMNFKVKLHS